MTGEPTIEISHLVLHSPDVLSGHGWDSTVMGKSTQPPDSLHCHHHHGESSTMRLPGSRKGKEPLRREAPPESTVGHSVWDPQPLYSESGISFSKLRTQCQFSFC